MKYSFVAASLLAGSALAAPRIGKRSSSADFTSPSLSSPDHETCSASSQLSCSSSKAKDSCCLEATNGILLSTQFWDYNPSTGPSDVFTLHGLWPDKCDGSFNQFCDDSLEVTNVQGILKDAGQTTLLNNMNTVWVSDDGSNESFWEHEFDKHGTCMQTIRPDCYSSDADSNQYIVDFYTTAYSLWTELPTYQWLSDAGFEPSNDETFSVSDFEDALNSHLGEKSVQILCDDDGNLDEVYYYFNLRGSVAAGTFVPTKATAASTCKDGFGWIPKGSSNNKK